ncbi:MAG TPA: pitrilysin family protein [Ignavibacteriales bacterium]|nr:pitrilysin family protein [Ignavibacteriales bacterium]
MKLLKYIIALTFLSASLYAQLDRSVPPKAAPAPEIKFGEYHKFVLDNGLKVFVVENHETPVVSLSLILHRDPILEKENAGYVDAAGELMRTGTKTHTKAQLDEEIDLIGASLSTSANSMYGSALKKYADKLFELFSDVAINAEFRQDELDKLKTQTLSALAAAKDEPGEIASRIRQKLYYGTGHPYSEFATEQTVKNFTLDMCKEYYQKYFIPNSSYLAIVGDINKDEAEKLAKKYLSPWKKGTEIKYTYPQPAAPKENFVALVDRKNSVQSTLRVGYPVDLKIGSKESIKSGVANTILGGGVFRLFQNLRETHSYTYGAYSSLASDRLVGNFTASAEVRNPVTDSALTQILYEMKRMREEPVPADELTKAKNYISGSFALSLERPQTVANFAINEERYGLPSDYYENYLKSIEEVTSPDVMAAASKYILPENSYIIVVGKAEEIADKLKPFGPIKYFDIYGNEYDPNASAAPADVTAKDILNDYIKAVGGVENIKKVNDKTTIYKGSVQGMTFKIAIYQKVPFKLYQEVSAAGMTTKLYVNGGKGLQVLPNGAQPLDSAALESAIMDADPQAVLKLDSLGITYKLKGFANEDGKQLYELEFTSPSGSVWFEYYDPQTKLKVKQTKTMKTQMGDFEQTSYFEDYRETAGGVKSPFKMTQKIGPQTIVVEAESIQVNTGLADSLFVIPESK